MKRRGRTPPFRNSDGAVIEGSIAEIDYWKLGGVDQWVMIRGRSLDNPVLVTLHGGPGFSEARLLRHHNSALEDHFTVVYWDQRGAGKSFDRAIPAASMTVQQFIDDLGELVDRARIRTGQDRVAIFGHSWGSALGALFATRRPEQVSAFIGSGQIGHWQAGEAASYAHAMAEAERRGNKKAIRELQEIGPPPYGADALWTERNWLQRFAGNLGIGSLWRMGRIFLRGPEWSIYELPKMVAGFRWSLDAMWVEVSRLNLLEAAADFAAPVFFLLGRQDNWVPPETSVAYFEALTAPRKELVWFENSGHEPFVDEATKFNRTMIDLVRPAIVG